MMSSYVTSAYFTRVESWRQQREAELRDPDGWLSLAGLFVLTEGSLRIGSASDSDILLPKNAPPSVGEISFHAGKATLSVTTAQPVLSNGAPVHTVELEDNSDHKQPTVIKVGTVSFFVHKFGDQYAIRIKDSAHPAIQTFGSCLWYEIQPGYCVAAKFTHFNDVQTIPIGTAINTTTLYRSIGAVDFVLHDQPLRLLATAGADRNHLFIVFRDATSGQETYPPARFLTASVDAAGSVELDFNQAYNPPCAFTPYATCPLPPPANVLTARIAAGERFPFSLQSSGVPSKHPVHATIG